jgi:hypothetical protein
MWKLIRRSLISLLVLVVGLVLQGMGIQAGALVAVVGLISLILVNLIAPWPWQKGWRD